VRNETRADGNEHEDSGHAARIIIVQLAEQLHQPGAMSADLTVDIRLNFENFSWSWEIRHARTNTLVESGAGRQDYPSADDAYLAGCARLTTLTAGVVEEAA